MARKSAPKKLAKKTSSSNYLHGFSREEQDRLYRQARFLEESVYEQIDFAGRSRVLEVGCGVGAQTEILLERFPKLKIQGVDASAEQLSRATAHLAKPIREKRVELLRAGADELPFEDGSFDGAFVCWLLEHLKDPVKALREINRVLKTGSNIYCTEVLNTGFYIHPYSPATLQYWFAFNDHQWNLGGDPFVGGKVANYLLSAGFQNVSSRVVVHHYDNRSPKKRSEMIDYTSGILLSGADGLIEAGKVTPALVKQMKDELTRLKKEPDAVFFDVFVQARAFAL